MKTLTACIYSLLLLTMLSQVGIAQDVELELSDSQILAITQRGAEQGDAEGQYFLGARYLNGRGVPQDFAKAIQWFKKAAEQGNAEAQRALGTAYSKGQGVPQDHTKAAQWYRKAADQGEAEAQFSLGTLYILGNGVIRDGQKGCGLLRASAEQGHNLAIEIYNAYCAN